MPVRENLLELKKMLPVNVTLVAVSKTKPISVLQEAYDAGQRDFGENYVQELAEKKTQLPGDIRWHFIGHLQSNKVKIIAPYVHLIHGVDSLSLLQEINKQGIKNNRIINCLLQIYIASEETKFGLSFEECETVLNSDACKTFDHIHIQGFMAMASNTDDKEQIRKEFHSLKIFQQHICSRFPNLVTLSFGMSSDYKIAIEEGSTMIRVGSAIFGERNYNS